MVILFLKKDKLVIDKLFFCFMKKNIIYYYRIFFLCYVNFVFDCKIDFDLY